MTRRITLGTVLGLTIAGGLLWFLTAASAAVATNAIHFKPAHQQPAAGHVFAGLKIVDSDGAHPLTTVSCSAVIGRKYLTAERPKLSSHKHVAVCGWHIPANAGGKTLRVEGSAATSAFKLKKVVTSHEFTWRVGRVRRSL
jgi:hypothetical protein